MWVDPMLLTNTKSHKRQKQSSQMEDYFDSLLEDLQLADERMSKLLDDPHPVIEACQRQKNWLRRNTVLSYFKDLTEYIDGRDLSFLAVDEAPDDDDLDAQPTPPS
ncbi:uncharacterized protein CC84DRAFT_1222823 [Paraphaeosphaeria sporulosa]|uniref:Uncharacterized protein n=1 Tax=Paraphaeosphaeria sporulosa TaxID=1460663 RepID=A0A177BWX6_9PLEO|nr:uncharacterized protein CC84DRAFT_1222823 [Paraphaeosphaeria sporulosa]OAF99814.1 hypothetical protein CC84DRAFT_1222823 [Paraphaeosphaeria sporulosa]